MPSAVPASCSICVPNPPAGLAWALFALRRTRPPRGFLRSLMLLVELQPLPDRLELRRAPRGQPTPIRVRMYARILVGSYDLVVPIEADQVFSQLLRAVASIRNRSPAPRPGRFLKLDQDVPDKVPVVFHLQFTPRRVRAALSQTEVFCAASLRPCLVLSAEPLCSGSRGSVSANVYGQEVVFRILRQSGPATQDIPSPEFAPAEDGSRARCRSALGFR